MWSLHSMQRFLLLFLLCALPASVLAGDVLTSDGYSMCLEDPNIQVQRLNVTYDRNTREITFDVAGRSTVELNVTLELVILAYGQQVYTRSFDPCDIHEVNMPQICPVPATTFVSSGSEIVPEEYASQIPGIVFNIPDLDGLVQLTVKNRDGQNIACIQSSVTNGQTFNIPGVRYAAAGMAAAALAFSATGAVAGLGHPGASTSSPSFGQVLHWFQGMATSGMLSVAYPKVYQSFTTNFAFSTGLVQWAGLQESIDNFRKATGGNLTDSSYQYLTQNATLMWNDGQMNTSLSTRAARSLPLRVRDAILSVNGSSQTVSYGNVTDGSSNSTQETKSEHFVKGIEAYVEQLNIPAENTFMTVLLVWAVIVGAIIVTILLVKVILELCSTCGKLPKSLESWRKRYWWRMAKVLTNLVLMLYGVWTLYCIYQFTHGDSWAAKALAGLTLGLFSAVLIGFTWKIYSKAHEYKKLDGDSKRLFQDKEVWIKYSLFYDSYKKSYWWLFVPAIVYMFARGCVIAGFDGNGLYQAAGQLIIEGAMLILLLWTRPYQRPSAQWINISIQVVRALSIGCVLLFVEELGISQTTKTITGMVLIVVQCVMTGILAILIATNAIMACVKENPHRRMRKEAEQAKLDQDLDNLTSLDPPRTSFTMSEVKDAESIYKPHIITTTTAAVPAPFGMANSNSNNTGSRGRYNPIMNPQAANSRGGSSIYSRHNEPEHESLMGGAAAMGHRRDESTSRSPPRWERQHHLRDASVEAAAYGHSRQPRLPDMDFGYGRAV